MIYQIHFTMALELVALSLSTFVLVWSIQNASRLKIVGVLSGLFGVVAAVVLIVSTAYFMYFPPPTPIPAESQKPKLQMQLPTSGPTKGGFIKPTKPSDGSELNKGTGIELPTMTVPQKTEN